MKYSKRSFIRLRNKLINTMAEDIKFKNEGRLKP